MRVLVMPDGIGAMTSARAGAVIAGEWPGAEVAVVPMGEAGRGFVQATADQLDVEVETWMLDGRMISRAAGQGILVVATEPVAEETGGIDRVGSSADLGRAVREAVRTASAPPQRILIDLAGVRTHDGGAGFLAGLGATGDRPLDAGVDVLDGLGMIDLAPAHDVIGDAELIGVVPDDQVDRLLLGLRGITSLLGREAGEEQEALLAVDGILENFADLVAPDLVQVPGVGACGGVGFALAALGGALRSGPEVLGEMAGVAATVPSADLVVTVCSVFDFATRGGGVVAEAARLAGDALRPCIVIAGEVLIGGREMRTMGVESAYAVRESSADVPTGGDTTAAELAEAARRVARTWSW